MNPADPSALRLPLTARLNSVYNADGGFVASTHGESDQAACDVADTFVRAVNERPKLLELLTRYHYATVQMVQANNSEDLAQIDGAVRGLRKIAVEAEVALRDDSAPDTLPEDQSA